MTKLMYKVTDITTGAIAMFERKEDAEKYCSMMRIMLNHDVSLSRWTWSTDIEE